VLTQLHSDIQVRLERVRTTVGHPGSKGDASESIWVDLLETYLPKRYQVSDGFVVDSNGDFSEQIDVIVFDRHYTPFIWNYEDRPVVPAESVYAVFEAKQTIDATLVDYARKKVASVRCLHRTSLPIPHAGGTYPAKPPRPIIGGVLSLESEWKPALGEPLLRALTGAAEGRLDLGCISAHGTFAIQNDGRYVLDDHEKATSVLLFELIARLQEQATVPMIDVRAYARSL
ncbi:MAG: hypothetical protein MI867_21815, partial [Pseudomonadales bacterium]|nr:hypothetical protein [Pseudomonadales bacterium]